MNAARVLNPLKWAFTFLLVVIGWVIFRAENLQVAWRMYEAMFSFGTWQLSELNRASLTGLQVGTLVLAYLVLAFFGLRQFYNQPLQTKAPKAAANSDEVAADGPASAQPRARARPPATRRRSPTRRAARWSTSRAGSASCPSWPPAWRCSCCSPPRC